MSDDKLKEALRRLPVARAPEGGWARIGRAQRRARRRLWVGAALAAGLGTLLVGLGHRRPARVDEAELIQRSQALEEKLHALAAPTVISVREADMEVRLEDAVGQIDRALAEGQGQGRAGLWRARISLLEAWVKLREPLEEWVAL